VTMYKVALFAGPSLPLDIGLPGYIDLLPPVKSGDIYALLNRNYSLIAILDGLFHGVPSIWHREILAALYEGIEVWGASSMGALRACELREYGMKGFGNVFRWYSDLLIDGDDEVALHHMAETPYSPITIPLVDIRHCLMTYLDLGIGSDFHELIISAARQVPYWDRIPPVLYKQLIKASISSELASNLINKIATTTSVKRIDALELVEQLSLYTHHSNINKSATSSIPNYLSSVDLYCDVSLETRASRCTAIANASQEKPLPRNEVLFVQNSNVHAFIGFWIEECAEASFKANMTRQAQSGLHELFDRFDSGYPYPVGFLTKCEIAHFYYLSVCFNELARQNEVYMDSGLIQLATDCVDSIFEGSRYHPAFPPILSQNHATETSLNGLAIEILITARVFNSFKLDLHHLIDLFNIVCHDQQLSNVPPLIQTYLLVRFFGISALGVSDSVKLSHHVKYVYFYGDSGICHA
jgi:hypothetical protein